MQNFERKNQRVRQAFRQAMESRPEPPRRRLQFSWSNWGFGMEDLSQSVERLARNGIKWIELHGNRYGPDLGYRAADVRRILSDHGMGCSGICGMFSPECELSSPSGRVRQNAIDYIRRNLELGAEVGASYFLIVPGAVGRPGAVDDREFDRSVETLRLVADAFAEAGLRGAVEPIRAAEVSLVHTFDEALAYIEAVGHDAIQHINGDIYHMQVEESHIAERLLEAGSRLTNLHLADSNRRALGEGAMDLDTMIMALYAIGYDQDPACFVTAEPLGPGGDPYPAMYGKTDPAVLDRLVKTTIDTWNERESAVLDALAATHAHA